MYLRIKANAEKWTESSIFCYERGCNCSGCYMKDMLETHCLMKMAVLELVKKFGKPPKEADRPFYSERELKFIELIKQGYNRFEITEIMDYNYSKTSEVLRDLYAKARKEGLVFKTKNTRKHLKEYRDWLEGKE